MKPIDGMQTEPMGMDLPGMGGAWASFLLFAAEQERWRKRFHRDTGHNLDAILGRSPMDKLIDQATGHEKAVLISWADWITENLWGEER